MISIIRFLFILFLSSIVYSQDYEMHSVIWKLDGDEVVSIIDRYPSIDDLYAVDSSLDIVKVRSYLLTAFNAFRSDYGSPLVLEDKLLSIRCQDYSNLLVNSFKHDPKGSPECIGYFTINILVPIVHSGLDFNRGVSDYIFDMFVPSSGHMGILLSNYYLHYGFGVTMFNGSIYVVIRCY